MSNEFQNFSEKCGVKKYGARKLLFQTVTRFEESLLNDFGIYFQCGPTLYAKTS